MLRRWLFGDWEFASYHLPSEWAGKDGAETYAIGREVRTRIQEIYTATDARQSRTAQCRAVDHRNPPWLSLAHIIRCAVQRHGLSVGANPTRQLSLQPVAIGAVVEATKRLKPSV